MASVANARAPGWIFRPFLIAITLIAVVMGVREIDRAYPPPLANAEPVSVEVVDRKGTLLRAFAEVTGIRAEPAYAHTRCWPEAQTLVPAGKPHLWDAQSGLGAAGDWCTGHRVEEAFLSGLSLALAVH